MPLLNAATKLAQAKNFHELRQGPQFQRTTKKFGKTKAQKQMQAIVLNIARKARGQ
jgi:hypothetical protein